MFTKHLLIFLTTCTSGGDLLAVGAGMQDALLDCRTSSTALNADAFSRLSSEHASIRWNSCNETHLPALVMIISVPNSLKRSHNSFPSRSTVIFLRSSLEWSSKTSGSSPSLGISLEVDFILFAGGGSVHSSSMATSLSFGDSIESKHKPRL